MATSPQMCVTIHTPNIRLFLRNTGPSWSRLQVTLNYTDKYGAPRTKQVASLSGGSSWSVSPQILFVNSIAPIVGGQGQTSVSFTFSTDGSDDWQIDDFYVDPLKSQ